MFGEIRERNVYYCEECNKIHKSCYELEDEYMCSICWSDVTVIEEINIKEQRKNKIKEILKSNGE